MYAKQFEAELNLGKGAYEWYVTELSQTPTKKCAAEMILSRKYYDVQCDAVAIGRGAFFKFEF